MMLRDFLEVELENRQSSGGSETDYVKEVEDALAEFDALRAELAKVTRERDLALEIARITSDSSPSQARKSRHERSCGTLDPLDEVAGATQMKHDILNRFSGAVQFSAEIECKDDAPTSVKLGLAVKVAVIANANLSGADLRNADLRNANLIGANLINTDLSGANMSGANMTCADLINADMTCADLSYADLSHADLSHANLMGANLRGADLTRYFQEGRLEENYGGASE